MEGKLARQSMWEKGGPDQKGKANSPLNSERSIHFLRTDTTTLKDYKHPELSLLERAH